ncbi:MAG: sigma-70 family RNA polymerase sigma factor [Actinomycetota bacterium]|nr:sigma-70 family RNA polymerase sigma factor [Actinomycetota bacterium]
MGTEPPAATSDPPSGTGDRSGPSSFTGFYERELAGQVRNATLLLGSQEAARDVVHDVFVAMYERWDAIAEPGPYVQRAVVNRCRDAQRHAEVARRHEPALVRDTPEIDAPLYDALETLPFNHRAAVVLRYYLQLTEAEIAERLDCPTGSVGPWIRRGLDRLATELDLHREDR